MNLRFLETFLWIARLGSFRAAAGKLSLTQAAVSGRIAALENDLGMPLFERGSRDIRLTSSGRTLVRYAEQIMATDQAMREALKGPRTVQGRIRLGIVESIVHTWFAPFIKRLNQTYPDLEIELTVESTLRLHDLLKRGSVDVALQTDPVIAEGIWNRPLGFLRMGFICEARAQVGDSITLEEIVARWPIVTFPRHSQPHSSLLEVAERAGVAVPRIHFVSSIAASMQLIDNGLGVGTLPVAALHQGVQQGRYQVLPCTSALPDLRLIVSWQPDPLTGLPEAVIAVAMDEMHQYAQTTDQAVAPSGGYATVF